MFAPIGDSCVARNFTGCCTGDIDYYTDGVDYTDGIGCTSANGTCHCDETCYPNRDCCADIKEINCFAPGKNLKQ